MILIFDTETISTNKPFCYNIGYVIFDETTNTIIEKREFVVEQIWHNTALFETAYFADKRPIYISAMRGKRAKLSKYGHIMNKMSRDIENMV